ncbi:MAG: hypothetical protein KAW17_08060 [Candidatus Eisenbacteria sp.]|nr:hypothetical protein [Candidatus Eisenbacteria bacterium]
MRLLGFVIVFVLSVNHATEAHEFFPMCAGSVWEYVGDETSTPYVRECVGWEDIWGIECAVMEYRTDPDGGLRNYWYEAADGALVLRGAYRSEEQFGFIYEPGIWIISAAPFLGEKLCFSVDIYNLPDSTYCDSFSFCHQIVEEGFVNVPAGKFYAYAVGGVFPDLDRGDYDLLGRKIDASQRQASMWFTADVGEVQFIASELYQLVSYSLPPSSLEVTSWSRLRALYRR